MKKMLLKLVVLLLLGNIGSWANSISIQDAEEKALKWIKGKTHSSYRIKRYYQALPKGDRIVAVNQVSNLKIIELQPKGWIIVSLDDSSRTVLAYSTLSEIGDTPPPSFLNWLKRANDYVDNCKVNHCKKDNELSRNNKYYTANSNNYTSNGDDDYVVRPLLWMGASSNEEDQGILWDQGQYYNALTPADSDGEHTWVGCVATAMGQVMRYYKYPSTGTGEHCYTPSTHSEYGEQCANFGEATYNWDAMPYELTSDNNEVATLLYHAGVSVDMDYAPEGSGAWGWSQALKKYFQYKIAVDLYQSNFTNIEWREILHTELDNSRPIYSSGRTETVGHAYIIDGYDADEYYHFNWGWGGYYNGKYLLDDEDNFPLYQNISIISPSDTSPEINFVDDNFSSCIRENLGLTNTDNLGELSVKYERGISCGNKNINSIDPIHKFENLEYLLAYNNNIQGDINLSAMRKLYYIDLDENNITSLNLSGDNILKYLYAHNNNIQGDINLSGMTKLESISLGDNNITSLNLSGDNSLTYINVVNNNIKNILLPINANVQLLSISSNPIDIFKISNLKNIEELYAYGTANDLQCWQKESLKMENNITNIYTYCNEATGEDLDTDNDGIINKNDIDDDNDGINDLKDTDIDGDGISNIDEEKYGLNSIDDSDATQDADGDGVSNIDEINAGTDPKDANDYSTGITVNDFFQNRSSTKMTLSDANLSCTNNNGRLATINELKDAYQRVDNHFVLNEYTPIWSSTENKNAMGEYYFIYSSDATDELGSQTADNLAYAHCVKAKNHAKVLVPIIMYLLN